MATLATLAISLTADTKSFVRSMEQTRRESARLERALKTATQPLQTMATYGRRATIALAGLTAAVVVGANRAAQYSRQIRSAAEQTGLAIESMQALAHAAGENNVEFSTLQTAMRGFARRAAEASRGNTQFLRGFERLGITQKEITNNLHDIEGLFMRVTEEISQMGNTADQSAVAMMLMSDAGRQMVPMLKQGSEGVRALMQEAEDLGLVLKERTVLSFDLLGRELDTTRQRTAVAGQEFLAGYIPALRLVDEWVNRGIAAFQGLDAEQRQNIIRATGMVAGFLGIVGALGIMAGALKAVIMFTKLTGLAMAISLAAPILLKLALVAAALLVFKRGWEENWFGIREFTDTVVGSITGHWDNLTKWWQESDFGQTIRAAWAELQAVWASDELTLPQKVIESVSIIANTIADLIPAVREIWDTWTDEDLSLGEKVLKTVSIVTRGVTGLIESIMVWWTGAALKLVERGAELLGLNPDDLWVTGFLRSLNSIWANSDLTFGQKVVETLKITPGFKWLGQFIEELQRIWNNEDLTLDEKAIQTVSLVASTITGLIESILSWWSGQTVELAEKVVTLLGLDPEKNALVGFLRKLNQIWLDEDLTFGEKVVESIRLVALTVVGLVESIIAWWIGQTLRLTEKTVEFLGLNPDQNALVDFLRKLNDIWLNEDLTFGQKIIESIGLLPGGNSLKPFLEEIRQIWINEELSLPDKVIDTVKVVIKGLEVVWDTFFSDIDEKVFKPLRQLIGTEPTAEWKAMSQWFLASEEERGQIAQDLVDRVGPTQIGPQPTLLDRFLNWITGGPQEEVQQIEESLQNLGEAASETAARIQLTADEMRDIIQMVAAESAGEPFEGQVGVAAVIVNRVVSELFSDTIEEVLREKNQFSPMWDGRFYQEFSEEALKVAEEAVMAALAGIDPTGGALFFWNPSASTSNWIGRNREFAARIGNHDFHFQSGTPWTGHGPLDEVAGVVHRQEAVIPAHALRKGPAGVLDFLGVPGFQAGKAAPVGGSDWADFRRMDVVTVADASFIQRTLAQIRGVIESARDYFDDERTDAVAEKFLGALDSLAGVSSVLETEFGRLMDALSGAEGDLEEMLAQMRKQQEQARERMEAEQELIQLQQIYSQALARLAERLDEVNEGLGWLARSLRFDIDQGKLIWDPMQLIGDAVGFLIGAVVDLIDTGQAEIQRRIANIPDPGQDILSIAESFRRFESIDDNIAERQKALKDLQKQQRSITNATAGGAVVGAVAGGLLAASGPIGWIGGALLGGLFGGSAAKSVATKSVAPQIAQTEQQIRDLERQIENARVDLINALGIAADHFASGIANAFRAADIDGFADSLERSVRDSIRTAMVQAFVAQVLEPQIMAMAEMVQKAFLDGGTLDMEAIEAQIEGIVQVSSQLYDKFDELGLTVDKVNDQFREFQRNVPTGFRVDAYRFAAAGVGMNPVIGDDVVRTLPVPHDGEMPVIRDDDRDRAPRGNSIRFEPGSVILQGITDPEEFWRRLQRIIRRENERTGGTIIATAAPGVTE